MDNKNHFSQASPLSQQCVGKKTNRLLACLFILMPFQLFSLVKAQNTSTENAIKISFDLGKRGPEISEDLFGIFFEEINHGGEGGLYGEAIVNRSFDDDWGSWYGWTASEADAQLVQQNLLNSAQRNAAQVRFNSIAGYLRNSGFDGIKVERDSKYTVSFWVRTNGDTYNGDIIARLVNRNTGANLGSVNFKGPFDSEWRKCEAIITGTVNENKAAFQLMVTQPTTLVFDMVSCFPPTFKDRPNGMRRDLAQMLADMHPRFMRFPGGCYVEGRTGWDRDPANSTRWEWKKTIGPIEERPGHRNQQWGYWVSDGQGYHEFLQFCEDIGAAAMFVCNVGMGHGWVQDYRNIGAYIQETLDAIEYANGDSTTTWGRVRARNGHPEPFNLKYVEIGNENCNFDFNSNSDQSDHYFERYIQFYNAIKAQWPDVITIANVEAWATDFPSWRSNLPVELVDEHYYRDSYFYVNNYEKYNGYARSGPKVYIGEYAANVGGGIGTLNGALAEAIFMQGMENNSDVVAMASFAPIFMNETYGGWNYDIIRFNNYMAYGIPSYYVQRMFGQYQGKQNLLWTEKDNVPQLESSSRHCGVGTWLASATFNNVEVSLPDGTVIYNQSEGTSSDWTRGSGTWAYTRNGIRQTNATTEGATYILNTTTPSDSVNYNLHATKTSGNEGFLIVFNYKDAQNYSWWNIGGWGNTQHGIENCINGVRSLVASSKGAVEANREYEIRIEQRGAHVRCYLDGELIHDTDIPAGFGRGVYTSASIDDERDVAIIKLTNPNPSAQVLHIELSNGKATKVNGEVLTSAFGTDENNTSNPNYVVPRSINGVRLNEDGTIDYEVPAYSFSVLNIDVDDVNILPSEAELPTAAVSYSFEQGLPVDDDGNYTAQLMSGASIIEMSDGNHTVYTGAMGSRGFVNLGTEMVMQTLGNADDYTVSIDVLNRGDNVLNSFSWALAFANGTEQYFGFINAAGGRDWYAEVKNGTAQRVASGAQLRTSVWHNLVYVQEGNMGKLYIDGCLTRQAHINVHPHDFVGKINGAFIARSPFAADAYMENSYFDNLRIYTSALSEEQVRTLCQEAQAMADDQVELLYWPNQLAELLAEARSVEGYADNMELTQAVENAQTTSSPTDAKALADKMDILRNALDRHAQEQQELLAKGEPANLSYLIRNGLFTQQSRYWGGTAPTDVADETAEHFSRTFDTFQVLKDMPAGSYRLEADAFYRCGDINNGHEAWTNQGADANLAELYALSNNGDNAVKVPNLYAMDTYTFSPYTFPDNLRQAALSLNTGNEAYAITLRFDLEETADLRVGIRKNDFIVFDWTAFDNFRLYYEGPSTNIEDVRPDLVHETNGNGTIYDLSGRKLDVSKQTEDSTERLRPGIYIVNGKKIIVR